MYVEFKCAWCHDRLGMNVVPLLNSEDRHVACPVCKKGLTVVVRKGCFNMVVKRKGKVS